MTLHDDLREDEHRDLVQRLRALRRPQPTSTTRRRCWELLTAQLAGLPVDVVTAGGARGRGPDSPGRG